MAGYKKVIIVYENTVREYDNALLLKAELVRRGYDVELFHKTHFMCWRKRKAAVLLPNSYGTDDLSEYAYWLNCNDGVYINLQYEQIFSERIKKNGYVYPKGKAKEIFHLCWGQDRFLQLIRKNVDSSKVKITGAIQLDFLRKDFDDFYLNRQTIAHRYRINEKKRWLLYISSFSYVDNVFLEKCMPKQIFEDEFVARFSKISVESQKTTLKWFEDAIISDQNLVIIYRKHPNETDNKMINELTKKYPKQFYDISDLSVKQWIKICDICTTWFSTSASEIYMAKKSFSVLRPYPIEHEIDAPFYYEADFVDTYEKFKMVLGASDQGKNYPISENIIVQFYLIDEVPTYIKVVDAVEDIIKTSYKKNILDDSRFALHRWAYFFRTGGIIKYIFKSLYQFIYYHFKIKYNGKWRDYFAISEWEADISHRKDKINKSKYETLVKIVNDKKY